MRALHTSLLVIIAVITLFHVSSSADGNSQAGIMTERPLAPPPDGYIHRPVLEFFTGLSCPACMGDSPDSDSPEKAVHDAYLSSLEDETAPHTTVVFHQLNGGGVDDLRTEESQERMRFYQPGISGTPDLEFDGGYVELGGFSTSQLPIDGPHIEEALTDCNTRYDDRPLRIADRLTWSFPYVFMEVDQVYSDGSFFVEGKIRYDGNARMIGAPQLRGNLYVFMVEDGVEAYSKVYDQFVVNDAVFRGYAIENEQVTLSNGDELVFSGIWSIPDAKVPIRAQNMYAVAAVYDQGDTDSGRGTDGNMKANSPRSVQSATSRSTAYDRGNIPPTVTNISIVQDRVSVRMDDNGGISKAVLFYNTQAPNSTEWMSVELTLTGEELCDDSGVCYAYSDTTGTADIEYDGGELYAQVLLYDDELAQASSEVYVLGTGDSASSRSSNSVLSSFSGGWIVLGLALVVLGPVLYIISRGRKGGFWKVLSMRSTAAIFIAVGLLISVFSLYSMVSVETDEVPDFSVRDTTGKIHTPETYSGRVLVLDIMSTDCSICKKEMPDLVSLYNDLKGRYGNDLEFLSVSVGEKDTDAMLNSFQNEYNARWPIGRNVGFITKFDAALIPKLVIVAENGEIAYTHTGAINRDDVKDAVSDAFSGDYSRNTISSSDGSLITIGALAAVFGALTFFSPCSFPLMPGFVSYYIANDVGNKRKNPLKAGAAAALGIITFFLLVGALVALVGGVIGSLLQGLMPIIGTILVLLGLSILLGFDSFFERVMDLVKLPFTRAKEALFGNRFGGGGGSGGLFAYGFGYGAAASSCMAPVFIGVIVLGTSAGGGFLGGFFGGALVFTIYALVLGVMMALFTLLISSGSGILQSLVRNTEIIKKVSGGLLTAAGIFVVWYAFWGWKYLNLFSL